MLFTYEKYWFIKQFSMIDDIKYLIIELCKIRIIKAPLFNELSTKFIDGYYTNDHIVYANPYTSNFKDVIECDCTRIWVEEGKIKYIHYCYGDLLKNGYMLTVNFGLSNIDLNKLKIYSSEDKQFKIYNLTTNYTITLKDILIQGIIPDYGYYETNGNVTFIYN